MYYFPDEMSGTSKIEELPCRNDLEAQFESMIMQFIDPDSVQNSDKIKVEKVDITDIVDFYLQNEPGLDIEAMIRAFIVSLHCAKDENSATLSRWLVSIRPDIIENLSDSILSIILMKKVNEFVKSDMEFEFFSNYIKWLIDIKIPSDLIDRMDSTKKQGKKDFLNTIIRSMNDSLSKNSDPKLARFIIRFYPYVLEFFQKF